MKLKNKVEIPWQGGTAYLRLRDGHWHMDVTTPSGQRIRRSTDQTDKAKAMNELHKLTGKLVRNEPIQSPKNYTVAHLLNEFIETQVNERVWDEKVASGFRKYTDRLFVPRFGQFEPRELTNQMLQDYRNERLRTTVTQGTTRKAGTQPKHKTPRLIQPATVDRELAFLRMAFRWKHVLNKDIIPEVPDFASRISGVVKKRTGFIGWNQFVTELLPKLPFHQRALAVCAMLWGGRMGEWLSLDWTDVNFENMVIHFDETKSDHPREVRILKGLMMDELKALKAHHEMMCPSEPAVFTYRGHRLQQPRKGFKAAVGKIGMGHLLFHDTRRSAAAILRDAGLSQEDIMEIMGHETDSMFRWYGIKPKNFLDRSAKQVAEHLEDLGKAS